MYHCLFVQNEPFSETKKRLQVRTGTNDKDLAKMKFAVIQPSIYTKPSPIQDSKTLFLRFTLVSLTRN